MKNWEKAGIVIGLFVTAGIVVIATPPSGKMTIKPTLNLVDHTAQVEVTVSPSDAKFTRTDPPSGCKLIGKPGVHVLKFGIESFPNTPSLATVKGIITVTVPPGGPPEAPFPVSAKAWFIKFQKDQVVFAGTGLNPKITMTVEYLPKEALGVSAQGQVKNLKGLTSSKPFHAKGKYEGDKKVILTGGEGKLKAVFEFTWERAKSYTGPEPKLYSGTAKMESLVPKGWESDAYTHNLGN
jgi:hypothetical protein